LSNLATHFQRGLIYGYAFEDLAGNHQLLISKTESKNNSDMLTNYSIRLISEKNNKKIVEWAMFDYNNCDAELDYSITLVNGFPKFVDLLNTGKRKVLIGGNMMTILTMHL
jgi:hypothetical protein